MQFPFEKEIILENSRVLIRPMINEDSINLLQVATEDDDLIQYSPSRIHTPQYLEEYVQTALRLRQNQARYTFTIFDKQAGEYAGSTSFLNISAYDKRLEIGATWIGRKFQRTGLNRNCKYLLLQYVFNEMEYERVEFRTDERNTASRTAIEGIGGKYEGLLRSHTLMNDGFRRNTVCYSILRPEWDAMKHTFLRT
jgi:RimJ/RimL family protein N-acetyltransferase